MTDFFVPNIYSPSALERDDKTKWQFPERKGRCIPRYCVKCQCMIMVETAKVCPREGCGGELGA